MKENGILEFNLMTLQVFILETLLLHLIELLELLLMQLRFKQKQLKVGEPLEMELQMQQTLSIRTFPKEEPKTEHYILMFTIP